MKQVFKNPFFSFNYIPIKTFTAGIVLLGTEIKAIRSNGINLKGAHVTINKGEAFILNMNISQYKFASSSHNETRIKKLLLKKKEINTLVGDIKQKGLTVVPVEMFFNQKGFLKVKIALSKPKRDIDRREEIKKRDLERENRRNEKDFY